eukprot:gene2976-5837_t
MRTITLIIICASLTLLHAKSSRVSSTGFSSGRRKDKKESVSRSPVKSKGSNRYNDENGDDIDDYEIKRPKQNKRVPQESRSREKSSKSRRMELVPWSNEPKGPTWRERLEEITKQGQNAYKDVYRRAKVLRSSAFEGMLLKATWPDDEPIHQQLLDEIIKYSIPAFKYGRTSSDDDPYHMTVHKLWTKMCEKDWRTIIKSLFILHSISRESSVEVCQRFAITIRDMARERNPKKPDHRYFDTRLVSTVDELGEPYESFIVAYATLVFYRTRNFNGKFDELKELSESSSEKVVVAKLKKAQQYLTFGLKCVITDKNLRNPIIGKVIQIVANDLKDIWKIFGAKLAPLAGLGQGVEYTGPKAAQKDVLALLKFYEETAKELQSYLTKAVKTCGQFRYKLSSGLDSTIENERLQECILRLSGGRVAVLAMDMDEQEKIVLDCQAEKWGNSSSDDDEEDEEDDEVDEDVEDMESESELVDENENENEDSDEEEKEEEEEGDDRYEGDDSGDNGDDSSDETEGTEDKEEMENDDEKDEDENEDDDDDEKEEGKVGPTDEVDDEDGDEESGSSDNDNDDEVNEAGEGEGEGEDSDDIFQLLQAYFLTNFHHDIIMQQAEEGNRCPGISFWSLFFVIIVIVNRTAV